MNQSKKSIKGVDNAKNRETRAISTPEIRDMAPQTL